METKNIQKKYIGYSVSLYPAMKFAKLHTPPSQRQQRLHSRKMQKLEACMQNTNNNGGLQIAKKKMSSSYVNNGCMIML